MPTTNAEPAILCANCGAENLGTNFCESCGARASATDVAPAPQPVAAVPAAPGDATTDPARAMRAVALVTYLLGAFIMMCIQFASGGGASIPEGAYLGVPAVTGGIVGAFMLIAAAIGKAAPAGKAFGSLLAIAYAIWAIVYATAPLPIYDTGVAYALPILAPALLFLSWGAGRPFRGPGFLAIFVVAALAIGQEFVSPALGNSLAGYAALLMAVTATDVIIVITAAKGFDGATSRGRRVEPLTRASLVLVLSTFAINGFAGAVASTGVAWYVVIILLLVVGIILGHSGFARARRRGELGRGIAATALVVGYIVLIANIAIMIWVATVLASLSSLLY